MTTSLDETTIKSGSDRAATINPSADCSSRQAGAQNQSLFLCFALAPKDLTLNLYAENCITT